MKSPSEPDQREIIGYSVRGEARKREWISLVRGIAAMVDENGWGHEVVFHGTSERRFRLARRSGILPTHLDLATEGHDFGSFWGDVHTAAAYAEDTAKERDGCFPALMAARTSVLLENCGFLLPDLATLESPLRGLTRLEVEAVSSKWFENDGYRSMGWKESLDDLRAIVAVHRGPLDPGTFVHVDRIEAVGSLMAAVSLPRP